MNERKKTQLQKKKTITLITVNFLYFYFDFLNQCYCHFIRMAVKMRRNEVFVVVVVEK